MFVLRIEIDNTMNFLLLCFRDNQMT